MRGTVVGEWPGDIAKAQRGQRRVTVVEATSPQPIATVVSHAKGRDHRGYLLFVVRAEGDPRTRIGVACCLHSALVGGERPAVSPGERNALGTPTGDRDDGAEQTEENERRLAQHERQHPGRSDTGECRQQPAGPFVAWAGWVRGDCQLRGPLGYRAGRAHHRAAVQVNRPVGEGFAPALQPQQAGAHFQPGPSGEFDRSVPATVHGGTVDTYRRSAGKLGQRATTIGADLKYRVMRCQSRVVGRQRCVGGAAEYVAAWAEGVHGTGVRPGVPRALPAQRGLVTVLHRFHWVRAAAGSGNESERKAAGEVSGESPGEAVGECRRGRCADAHHRLPLGPVPLPPRRSPAARVAGPQPTSGRRAPGAELGPGSLVQFTR
ncbi:unannotated protein [freshwater metagenome]|uniref:Unannotated protein n=1 Tax=freshwater metagenome TaxID=449393 RepID=A0A6J7L1G5_9ZZZZ